MGQVVDAVHISDDIQISMDDIEFSAIRSQKGMDVLVVMLNALQGAFYVTLAERREKDERFVFGWFANRVRID